MIDTFSVLRDNRARLRSG